MKVTSEKTDMEGRTIDKRKSRLINLPTVLITPLVLLDFF